MDDIEKQIIEQKLILQKLDDRLTVIETQSWLKSKNFWAGLLAIPVFIALGGFVDFLSKNPHFNNMFHGWIGTKKLFNEELKSSDSEIRSAVEQMIFNNIKTDAYGDSIELGAVKPEKLTDCLLNLTHSNEHIDPNLMLVEQDEQDGVDVMTSNRDCTESSNKVVQSKNSVFSTISKDTVDLYLAINISQLVFAEPNNTPIFVDVTDSFTPEKIKKAIKFQFDNGINDLELNYDGAR